MSGGDDRSGMEVLSVIIGATALIFGVEAVTWWLAHQFCWWTFSIGAAVGAILWQSAKAVLKEYRQARKRRRVAQKLGERIQAARGTGWLS